MDDIEKEVFHEKQSLQRCGVHTINNLFQRQEVTQKEMDEIARNLSPGSLICPHKSVLGTGNYDVNVIMSVLTLRGKVCKWWDRRRDVSEMRLDGLLGIIVNRQSAKLAGLWKSKHWYAITLIDGSFYNCNSTLEKPRQLADHAQLFQLLREEIEQNGEVIRVLHEDESDEKDEAKEGDGKDEANEADGGGDGGGSGGGGDGGGDGDGGDAKGGKDENVDVPGL